MTPADADKARKAAIADDRAGVVERHRPSQRSRHALRRLPFHLYRYKVYTDVRLVFARNTPSDFSAATRTTLNTRATASTSRCLRVYDETASPRTSSTTSVKSHDGVRDGELVFVAGHPRTDRAPAYRTRATGMRDRDLILPYRCRSRPAASRPARLCGRSDRSTPPGDRTSIFGIAELAQDPPWTVRRVEGSPPSSSTSWSRAEGSGNASPSVPSWYPWTTCGTVSRPPRRQGGAGPALEIFEEGNAFWSELFGTRAHSCGSPTRAPSRTASASGVHPGAKRARTGAGTLRR